MSAYYFAAESSSDIFGCF